MRVFVTGATGFVGSAVVEELLGAGHQVLGLTRSEAAAAALTAAGAEPHPGSLRDPDSLRAGAAASDGVVHLAFENISAHTDMVASCALDRQAIEVMGAALAGSDRPLVVTSAAALLPKGRFVIETDSPDTSPLGALRGASEGVALAFAERGVRATVVRLPLSVHDAGDHGFVPTLIEIARAAEVSGYPGDGSNRWTGVHRLDAARLYRLTLEQAPAGTCWHAVADAAVPFREIAEVIGRQLHLPVAAVADPAAHFGWLAPFTGFDSPASNALTRERLGWEPMHPGLLADLEKGHYFGRG
ncbi:SDR family oxidoreductase [Nocardia yamanashiensis]|uniref:SDR family oxidoreductase n=1 Tax=Nocardia yamanashiensis TaxID=209247 RepID=UPI001E2D97BA|nr:SDR family oxidoreductase [Nocardia yamanashiensis]UGT40553.1 SDR family oxidoreductase [Nocardia yamanashiensis]